MLLFFLNTTLARYMVNVKMLTIVKGNIRRTQSTKYVNIRENKTGHKLKQEDIKNQQLLLVWNFLVRLSLRWSPLLETTTTVYSRPAVNPVNSYDPLVPVATGCSSSPCSFTANPVFPLAPASHVTVNVDTLLALAIKFVGAFGSETSKQICLVK